MLTACVLVDDNETRATHSGLQGLPIELLAHILTFCDRENLVCWSLASRSLSAIARPLLWSRICLDADVSKRHSLDEFLASALRQPRLMESIRSLTLHLTTPPSRSFSDVYSLFPPHPTEEFWARLLTLFNDTKRLKFLFLDNPTKYPAATTGILPAHQVLPQFFSILKSSSAVSRITHLSGRLKLRDVLNVFGPSEALTRLSLRAGADPAVSVASSFPSVCEVEAKPELISKLAETGRLKTIRCTEGLRQKITGAPFPDVKFRALIDGINKSPALERLQLWLRLDHSWLYRSIRPSPELSFVAHPNLRRLAVTSHCESGLLFGEDLSSPELQSAPILYPFRNGTLRMFPSLVFCRLLIGQSEIPASHLGPGGFPTAETEIAQFLNSAHACGDALKTVWIDCMNTHGGYPGGFVFMRVVGTRGEGAWAVKTQFVDESAFHHDDLLAVL